MAADFLTGSEDVILNMSPPPDLVNGSGYRPYFGEFFWSINLAYLPFHGYLSLLVCVFGIFANILNIVVLTR